MTWDFLNSGVWVTCCNAGCSARFFLCEGLYKSAKEFKGHNGVRFYCPYGHSQYFVAGETEAERFKRERDALATQLEQKRAALDWERQQRTRADNKLRSTRGVVTRMRKRVAHGVCTCCNRSFTNLRRHMETKHPAMVKHAKK